MTRSDLGTESFRMGSKYLSTQSSECDYLVHGTMMFSHLLGKYFLLL